MSAMSIVVGMMYLFSACSERLAAAESGGATTDVIAPG
jgi:hypothetical protein